MTKNVAWTSDEVNKVEGLLSGGMTRKQAAEATGRTHDSIIGMARRMGWSSPVVGAVWTPARIERMKQLWADGKSASQIAAELGGITRNAVIGKLNRENVPRRAPKAPRQPRARRLSPTRKARFTHAPRPTPAPRPKPIPIEDMAVPVARMIPLLELTAEMCRFPIGDPGEAGFGFCGCRQFGDLPYCEYHARVAYQPARDWERSNSYAVRLAGHETPHLVPA